MDVGVNCYYKTCKRLDFLPFTCGECYKIFCKDHRFPEQHDCKKNAVHPSHQLEAVITSFHCSLPGCKKKELVEVSCPHCEEIFCLQHRHQVEHNCPALIPKSKNEDSRGVPNLGNTSLAQGRSQLTGRSRSSPRGSRVESIRDKVLLMKLKMKAEGSDSIPLNERVYYEVTLPFESGLPVKAMFFSKEWSVGKTVDFIAQKCKLRNENNLSNCQEKLVLYNVNGEIMEMSQPLNSLLDSLPDGGTLILKYIQSK